MKGRFCIVDGQSLRLRPLPVDMGDKYVLPDYQLELLGGDLPLRQREHWSRALGRLPLLMPSVAESLQR